MARSNAHLNRVMRKAIDKRGGAQNMGMDFDAPDPAARPAIRRVGEPEPIRLRSDAPEVSKRYKWGHRRDGQESIHAARSGDDITLHHFLGNRKVRAMKLKVSELPDHPADLQRHVHNRFGTEDDSPFSLYTRGNDAACNAIRDVTKGVRVRAVKAFRIGFAGGFLKGFKQNQPRVPKGNLGGGQWTRFLDGKVQINPQALGSTNNPGELQKRAESYGKEHCVGNSYVNEDTQHDIRVTNSGIEKVTSGRAERAKLLAVVAIPDMIRHATYVGAVEDRKKRRNIHAFHYYDVPVQVGDESYNARMTVMETNEGKLYYYHGLTELKPAGTSQRPLEELPGAHTPTAGSEDSIAKSVALVKSAEPPVAHRMRVNGLLISVENPRGSIRTKKGSDGEEWHRRMFADYGRIVGARGADGDQVDVFVGSDHTSKKAFLVQQLDRDGKPDEVKVMLGVGTAEDAKTLYLKNYPAGWKVGPVIEKEWPAFLEWLKGPQSEAPRRRQSTRGLLSLMLPGNRSGVVHGSHVGGADVSCSLAHAAPGAAARRTVDALPHFGGRHRP